MQNPNQKAIENLLTEIEEILKLIETHQGAINPVPDDSLVITQTELIEKSCDHIHEFCDKVQKPGTLESPDIGNDKKQLLLRAKEIENEARAFHKSFEQALQKNKKSGNGKKGGKETAGNRQMKERKKLFKTIGGDKKWIPL